jgi:hypothetical protein
MPLSLNHESQTTDSRGEFLFFFCVALCTILISSFCSPDPRLVAKSLSAPPWRWGAVRPREMRATLGHQSSSLGGEIPPGGPRLTPVCRNHNHFPSWPLISVSRVSRRCIQCDPQLPKVMIISTCLLQCVRNTAVSTEVSPDVSFFQTVFCLYIKMPVSVFCIATLYGYQPADRCILLRREFLESRLYQSVPGCAVKLNVCV